MNNAKLLYAKILMCNLTPNSPHARSNCASNECVVLQTTLFSI